MKPNSNIPCPPSPNTHGFEDDSSQNEQIPGQPKNFAGDAPRAAGENDKNCASKPRGSHESRPARPARFGTHAALDAQEIKLLAITLVQSAGILALATVILAYIVVAIRSGDPIACLTNGSWIAFLIDQCTLPPQWWCAPLVMIGLYLAVNLLALLIYPGYRRDELDLRQGINGELIFLPAPILATLVPLDNIFEETTFRGCLIPLLAMGCAALGLDAMTSAVIAVVGSTLVFWLVHWQYRNKLSVAMTLVGGATLGAIYVISQSVLVCIIAHVAYNWFVLYFERMIARDDPNYFGGKQPTHYVSDLLSK